MDGMTLTAREAEVLALMVRGLKQREIAARLHMSPLTVKTHLGNMGRKLGMHTAAELKRWGLAHGIGETNG